MIILVTILVGCNHIVVNTNSTNEQEVEKIQVIQKDPPETTDSEEANDTGTDQQSQNIEQIPNNNQVPPSVPTTPYTPNGSTFDRTLIQAQETANFITNTLHTVKMNAYLRSGPGIGYSHLGEVPAGTSLYVQSTSVEADTYRIWCYVNYNSKYGWISYKTLNPGYSLQTEFRSGN